MYYYRLHFCSPSSYVTTYVHLFWSFIFQKTSIFFIKEKNHININQIHQTENAYVKNKNYFNNFSMFEDIKRSKYIFSY